MSVPFALKLFQGTKLFNRDLAMNPRSANGNHNSPQTNRMPSLATTNANAVLGHPGPMNPFRHNYPVSTALAYGPSLPRTMQNMLPTPTLNDRRAQLNRDELNLARDQINYLLKAAPQLLPLRNVASTVIGDFKMSLNDGEHSRNRSNANGIKQGGRQDKPAHRAERSQNNRDRRGQRGNSPTPSSSMGRGGFDRRNNDRQRNDRNNTNGRRR